MRLWQPKRTEGMHNLSPSRSHRSQRQQFQDSMRMSPDDNWQRRRGRGQSRSPGRSLRPAHYRKVHMSRDYGKEIIERPSARIVLRGEFLTLFYHVHKF